MVELKVIQVERIVAVAENLQDECEEFTGSKLTNDSVDKFIRTVRAYATNLELTAKDSA